MFKSENEDWYRYSANNDWILSSVKDCGKWICYYKELSFAKELVEAAINEQVVIYAKHTKGPNGVVCFYTSGTELAGHHRVINFLKEKNLIRLTQDLKYFDITFKFNGQSWSKEYGNFFEGLLKLSDFIDLDSGKYLETPKQLNMLSLNDIRKPKTLQQSDYLKPIISKLDTFLLKKFNQVLTHNNDNTDLNDKIIYLAPLGYNINLLYGGGGPNNLLIFAALLIDKLLEYPDPKIQQKIVMIKQIINPDIDLLFRIFENQNAQINGDLCAEQGNISLATKFISFYNHATLSEELCNCLSYLIYLAITKISKQDIDKLSIEVDHIIKKIK